MMLFKPTTTLVALRKNVFYPLPVDLQHAYNKVQAENLQELRNDLLCTIDVVPGHPPYICSMCAHSSKWLHCGKNF